MSARDVIADAVGALMERETAWTDDECADAILPALSAAGFVVAPREPTAAMHAAARDWSLVQYNKAVGKEASVGIYRAMLAAVDNEND